MPILWVLLTPAHRGLAAAHAACACLQGPNPNVLYGALVGGPNNQDYFDNLRSDYVLNEVALDYNSGDH